MLQINDKINNLRGIGPYYETKLKDLNIITIRDLLFYFPFRYQDFTHIKNIINLTANEQATVIASITKIKSYRTPKKHMLLITATAEDESGSIEVVWFNQPFIIKTLKQGMVVSLSGKVKQQGKKLLLESPVYELISQDEDFNIHNLKHTGRLVPIYSETEGISSKMIRSYVKRALKIFLDKIPEPLPPETRQNYNLMDIKNALSQIHFPDSQELANEARRRFIFEEMLLVQIHLLNLKKRLSHFQAPKIEKNIDAMKEFISYLPFKLTNAQRKAIWEMMQDIETGIPMNRLLEGDVGSGKTVVAIAIAYLFLKKDFQVAFMAPTEVLAKQHFQTIIQLLKPFDIKIACLTSDGVEIKDGFLEGKVSKEYLLKSIAIGIPWLVVGTHSLIQKNVQFGNLGFVIIDEQHRFGVEQRAQLLRDPNNSDEFVNLDRYMPHFLSMTATPIPRTLALAMYGDLELSILDEMPKGRQQIITKIVSKKSEDKMYNFIQQQINEGRQAFIICPRIEDTSMKGELSQAETHINIDKDKQIYKLSKQSQEPNDVKTNKTNLFSYSNWLNYEVKAVKKEYEKIKKIFPEFKIEMLHGKMKPKEKDDIMRKFYDNKIQILVATSVIEVGIDVPNATIMVIEGAEHFGLSQLHQFRGRVGRSEYQSYCFLFTESYSKTTRERLKAMLQYSNGFKLAEIDLNLRGPGEFFGVNQSGFPDLAMQALSNTKTLAQIHNEAKRLVEKDSTLESWPHLLQRYQEFLQKFHME